MAVVPPVSQFIDVRDVLQQNLKNNQMKQSVERRNTIGAPLDNRNRNITAFTPVSGNKHSVISDSSNQTSPREHKKLDRSYSEPCEKLSNNNSNANNNQRNSNINSSRYKTELCRPFEENGFCKYADKCQFAHGMHELRTLARHPKYKTELCRTFHTRGLCPYGPRCNFIHNEDLRKINQLVATNQQAQRVQQASTTTAFSQSPPPAPQRPTTINFNSSFDGSLGSTAESSPPSSVGSGSPSLSPVFFEELNPMNSLPPFTPQLNNTTSVNPASPVFSFPEYNSMNPLNIKTQLTAADLATLTEQFDALLNLNQKNINNRNNNHQVFGEWDCSNALAPLSSPDSVSGESTCSNNSSNNYSTCGSPMEVSKNFRLPVFNHIAREEQQLLC
ncbi:hypothetical protein CHS0354_029142 [Potamilus streckersoni]|uniref:C3H1-type domain-containing protein n=1 Tax=Potamilus streckersoni TaxID=2493646 RepID=A0AAE0SWV6_9BIVA|nr:hypothetical protein CHS0354_029142 [Potamilus streckersoni]